MPKSLEETIRQIVGNNLSETQIQQLFEEIYLGQATLATGERAVALGGSANGALLVTGDRNILIHIDGSDIEVLANITSLLERPLALAQMVPTVSVDRLVQQARDCLHDDIQRLHGTMPLWGVGHWVPLSKLFVDVNLLEGASNQRRLELADLWQDFKQNPSYRSFDRIGLGKQNQRVSGLDVLSRDANLMVLGKPGSGKTTYLQRLALECNAGTFQEYRIPVLIKLRDFVDDGREVAYSLKLYLGGCWRLSEEETKSVLDVGGALVLLDGLDEVGGIEGQTIAKQVKQFTRTYSQVQTVITCRTQSQESQFDRFDYVEVADFSEPQIKAFVEHWFQTVCPESTIAQSMKTAFLDRLFEDENRLIRELVSTPLLLSLTCAVFHQTGKFYSKRSRLYEEGIELLLEQWDKSRGVDRDEVYRNLSIDKKFELLSYLARKKMDKEQYVLFSQTEIEEYISEFLGVEKRTVKSILKTIESQHGLVIERANRVWSFSHLTFQEYLVAKQFYNPTSWKELLTYITKRHWREVFLIVISIVKSPDKLVIEAKHAVDSILAADSELQNVLEILSEQSKTLGGNYNLAAARALYFRCKCLRSDILSSSFETHLDYQLSPSTSVKKNTLLSADSYLGEILALARLTEQLLASNHQQIGESWYRYLYFLISDPSRGAYYGDLNSYFCDVHKDLPVPGGSITTLTEWWEVNGLKLVDRLNKIVLKVGSPVSIQNFSEAQQKLLNCYYDATQLLFDLLSNESCVSNITKESILETLFLPASNIKSY